MRSSRPVRNSARPGARGHVGQQQAAAFGGLLSVLVSAAYLSLGFAEVDGRFLPDDTYYTLTIARNIFGGHGASMDGVIPTSGFQPLIALLELPLFAMLSQPEALTLAAVGISALSGALAAALAGAIVARDTGAVRAGLFCGALMALSPAISANALNGLETSLAAALMLWVLWLVQGADRATPLRRFGLIGGVVGLAVLARIDSVLLLAPAGLWGLSRFGPGRAGLVVLVAAIVVSPWVLYCLRFGGLAPESGAAVRQIVAFYIDNDVRSIRDMRAELFPALGLFIAPSLPLAGIIVIFGAWLASAAGVLRARRMSLRAVLLASAMLYLAFYLCYLPAFWFFDRYLNPVFCVSAMLLAIEGAALAGRARRPALVRGISLVAGGALAVTAAGSHVRALVWPAEHPVGRGYARQAAEVLERLPQGAVLAAMQSGALSWGAGFPPYAQAGIRVVNLDGVVNRQAKDAIGDHRLAAYLRAIDATHFADWPINVHMLLAYAGEPEPSVLGERILRNPPFRGFDLYRIAERPGPGR